MFGQFVKSKRLSLDLSLREFCKRIEEDPGNWSKIERNLLAPPKNTTKLSKIANALKIKKKSKDWETLNDLAHIDAGTIPSYIMDNKEVLQALPAFFRTIGNVKPTREELEQLINKLKQAKE